MPNISLGPFNSDWTVGDKRVYIGHGVDKPQYLDNSLSLPSNVIGEPFVWVDVCGRDFNRE